MKTQIILLLIAGASVLSCSAQTKPATPIQVMKKYARLVGEMKADSISQMFTTDAEVGHEGQRSIRGRDSIYLFLSSFKDVKVVRNADSVTNVSAKNDSAVVEGFYRQTVIISGKDTVNVKGQFTATMVADQNRNWLISKMRTRSL